MLQQLNQVWQTSDSARGLIVSMPDVLFDTGKVRSQSPPLANVWRRSPESLLAYPDIRVEIDGYTDSTGSLEFNERLSQQRADSVRGYLSSQGVNWVDHHYARFWTEPADCFERHGGRTAAESAGGTGGVRFVDRPGYGSKRSRSDCQHGGAHEHAGSGCAGTARI